MSRQVSQSLQASKSLAQLLALNALFDAVRAGEAGREATKVIQAAAQSAKCDLVDAGCDALLSNCYVALMEGSERPPRLS
jgi:hypothetical protein